MRTVIRGRRRVSGEERVGESRGSRGKVRTGERKRTKKEYLHSRSPDYTKGIFQSIGFKEFHAYLTLPEEERASEKVR